MQTVTVSNPPAGYKAEAEFRVPRKGEYYLDGEGNASESVGYNAGHRIVLTPFVRKYDWSKSKTAPWPAGDLTTTWMPHDGGLCPFDTKSVNVRVLRTHSHGVSSTVKAVDLDWGLGDIVAVQFVSLVEGVEW